MRLTGFGLHFSAYLCVLRVSASKLLFSAYLRVLRVSASKSLRFAFLTLAFPAMLGLACEKGATLSGAVRNGRTGQPIPSVTLKIAFLHYDANGNWVDGGRETAWSDADGAFTVAHPDMRARFTVVAEKPGFYPNHDLVSRRTTERQSLGFRHNLQVVLSPVESPQPLPRGSEGIVRYYPPGRKMGWQFATGQMAPEQSSDFVIEPDESGRGLAFLAARGQGGFRTVRGLSGPWALYNLPEAPPDGYEPRIDLREAHRDDRPCYYIRTADGRHYAKIAVVGPVRATEYQGVQFEWAWQPNGSRALEIPLEASAR